MFMRSVKSRNFFEQMKGRGVRVVNPDEFQGVTPDAAGKTHFVIVDCVAVTEQELSDTYSLERQKTVAFESLMNSVAFGSTDPDILSSMASRLARMAQRLGRPDLDALTSLAGGKSVQAISSGLVEALDPDRQMEEARRVNGLGADITPTDEQVAHAASVLLKSAAARLATNPALRKRLVEMRASLEQTIDTTSKDQVLLAGFSAEARERAKTLVVSFEQFITDNKDEIDALQILYSQPHTKRLRFADIKALAEAIQSPPRRWTPELLWAAYEALERDKVRASSGPRLLTDIVSLVRFALHQDGLLVPYRERIEARFEKWLLQQETQGRTFSPEQRQWLELIRDHIAASVGIEMDDFDYSPFAQKGGAGKAYQVFGQGLKPLIDELNEVLAA